MFAAPMCGRVPQIIPVFSADIWTGDNASTNKTVASNRNLFGYGGMVLTSYRTDPLAKLSAPDTSRLIFDTVRGFTAGLFADATSAETTAGYTANAFDGASFTLGCTSAARYQAQSTTWLAWTLLKQQRFFDIVTYTGDGTNSRAIAHNLGVAPGMVWIKKRAAVTDWIVWHRSSSLAANVAASARLNTASQFAQLDGAAEYKWGGPAGSPDFNSSTFQIGYNSSGGGANYTNASAATYVAYLFAHDTAAAGRMLCGGATTDGSGNFSVNHGWAEGAQAVLLKSEGAAGDWLLFDKTRTPTWSGSEAILTVDSTSAESSAARLSESGTTLSFAGLSATATYVYMLIRG